MVLPCMQDKFRISISQLWFLFFTDALPRMRPPRTLKTPTSDLRATAANHQTKFEPNSNKIAKMKFNYHFLLEIMSEATPTQ